jgi:hypothetical protein
VQIFLVVALFIVVGGIATATLAWALERSHRIESGFGDKLILIGLAAGIAGLPLLVVSLIYAFG